jgi:hypothetical protein
MTTEEAAVLTDTSPARGEADSGLTGLIDRVKLAHPFRDNNKPLGGSGVY